MGNRDLSEAISPKRASLYLVFSSYLVEIYNDQSSDLSVSLSSEHGLLFTR